MLRMPRESDSGSAGIKEYKTSQLRALELALRENLAIRKELLSDKHVPSFGDEKRLARVEEIISNLQHTISTLKNYLEKNETR